MLSMDSREEKEPTVKGDWSLVGSEWRAVEEELGCENG